MLRGDASWPVRVRACVCVPARARACYGRRRSTLASLFKLDMQRECPG